MPSGRRCSRLALANRPTLDAPAGNARLLIEAVLWIARTGMEYATVDATIVKGHRHGQGAKVTVLAVKRRDAS